jgi:predicted nucleotidyltransferase
MGIVNSPSRVRLPVPYDRIAEFCRRHRIRRLAFFGSVLREDFAPDSDVDVLIDLDAHQAVTLFTLARLQNDLGDLLKRPVDLHMPETLNQYLRDKVLRDAEDVYVAA